MPDDRHVQGDLQRFEASHSAEGLFVRYARGRVASFWHRQLFILAGTLAVGFLVDPSTAGTALSLVLAGEVAECVILRSLLRRHPDGRFPQRLRWLPMAATLVQSLGLTAALWLLFSGLGDPSGHVVLVALLGGAALNAGLTIGHVPRLATIRLGIYGCGAVAIVVSEFLGGVALGAVLTEIVAMLLIAQFLWLAIADLRNRFERRLVSQREFLRKSAEVEEAKRILAERDADGRRLALVARHASDGMFIVDNDFRIEFVNETFTKLSGYTLDDALGEQPRNLFSGPNTDHRSMDEFSDAIRGRRAICTEILSYTKDGREIWAEVNISPLADEAGGPAGLVGVWRDV
jgi:PAS domain S-box-containing protein